MQMPRKYTVDKARTTLETYRTGFGCLSGSDNQRGIAESLDMASKNSKTKKTYPDCCFSPLQRHCNSKTSVCLCRYSMTMTGTAMQACLQDTSKPRPIALYSLRICTQVCHISCTLDRSTYSNPLQQFLNMSLTPRGFQEWLDADYPHGIPSKKLVEVVVGGTDGWIAKKSSNHSIRTTS